MTEKQQAYIAAYAFAPPKVKTVKENEVTHYFVDVDGEDVRVYHERLVAFMREKGIEVRERIVVETSEDSDLPEWLRASIRGFDEKLEEAGIRNITSGEDGGIDLSGWGWCYVRTPSRLGTAVHLERRRLVEAFFNRHGIAFTLDCRVELSSNVCQPLRLIAQ